ncbi:hypothetical protein GCM10010231_26280 [Streptomyces sindenensis]|nr:hypothetical protein GCM10010231_26280 [Streptomyces sindenensis]
MPSPVPQRQSVQVCQKRLSTRAAGGAEEPAGEDGAADAGAAEEATVPALAAAASAAVRTVLREVGLVMVVTPGRMRKVVCGCRAVCGSGAVRSGAVRVPCGSPTIPVPGRIGPAVRQPPPNQYRSGPLA